MCVGGHVYHPARVEARGPFLGAGSFSTACQSGSQAPVACESFYLMSHFTWWLFIFFLFHFWCIGCLEGCGILAYLLIFFFSFPPVADLWFHLIIVKQSIVSDFNLIKQACAVLYRAPYRKVRVDLRKRMHSAVAPGEFPTFLDPQRWSRSFFSSCFSN